MSRKPQEPRSPGNGDSRRPAELDPEWRRKALEILRTQPLPRARALEIVGRLFWGELVQVASDVRMDPRIRRRALDRLQEQWHALGTGEQVAVARKAPDALLPTVLESSNSTVVQAALQNGRVREAHVLGLLRREGLPASVLSALARHPKWGHHPQVRQRLFSDPRTPAHVALAALRQCDPGTLERLEQTASTPRLIRVAVERLLETRGTRKKARRSRPGLPEDPKQKRDR